MHLHHEEEAKEASSIIKLFTPFKLDLPIHTYRRFAVDGNNFLGGGLQKVFEILWKLHPHKVPSQEDIDQLTLAVNNAVDDYFRHLQPLICSNSRDNLWVVFDGLKLKYLVWPGAKKHTYYWPTMAEEATKKAPENQKQKPQNFFYFLDYIHSAIKNNLEDIGVKVLIAPYEADSQIVKMYNENIIDCVISEDYQFVHFGVPMVLPQFHEGRCSAIDLGRIRPEELDDLLLRRWVEEADRQKKLIFSVLSGSKYMSHFRAFSFRQIMETVLECSCLADFFRIASEKHKVPRIKNFRGTFEQTSGNLLLLYQFQICYSFINKRQEPLSSGAFERYFRQNKINKNYNRIFDKVFSLIGDIVEHYDSDEKYRTGRIKLHNQKKRARTSPVLGQTIQEKIEYLYSHHQWIAKERVGQIFPKKE